MMMMMMKVSEKKKNDGKVDEKREKEMAIVDDRFASRYVI
jgi:hypothetical protein